MREYSIKYKKLKNLSVNKKEGNEITQLNFKGLIVRKGECKQMRKENGVTLIGLVVTIIVLIILASIGTYTGLNSVKEAKFTKFRTNLEIMQAQVDLLSEKYKTEIEEAETNGKTFTAVRKEIPPDLFSFSFLNLCIFLYEHYSRYSDIDKGFFRI